MADIIDRHIIMLAPEERHCGVALAPAEHVACRGLALPLGDNPVFDPQPLAAVRIGPAGDVSSGENPGRARFKVLVYQHPAIYRQSGLLREVDPRPHADPDHDKVGVDGSAVIEPHPLGFDGGHRVAEMEHDAMALVQLPYEVAELRAEYALHRPRLGRDDVNLDLAMTQRGGGFKPDEAGTEDDGAVSLVGASDQIAAVGERAQRAHMR